MPADPGRHHTRTGAAGVQRLSLQIHAPAHRTRRVHPEKGRPSWLSKRVPVRGPAREFRRTGAAVVAVANQKGGVAKTTSVACLGAAFAERGKRVLLVDLDAQACLTFSLGVDPDDGRDVGQRGAVGKASMPPTPSSSCEEGLDLVPSVIELAGAEAQLLSRPGREYVLRTALEPWPTTTTSSCSTARRRWAC